MKTSEVLIKLHVPKGKYCWEFLCDPPKICGFFDNEGGHSVCEINRVTRAYSLKDKPEGVLKDGLCSDQEKEG